MSRVWSRDEQEALLRLIQVDGVGSSRIRSLVGRFRTPGAVLDASEAALASVDGIDRTTATKIKRAGGEDFARQQLQRMRRLGVRLITFWDAEYPALLKQIYDPPVVLFVRGEIRPEDRNAVAVVGTRQPSAYGKLVTERLTADLVRHGLTVISGLAYGIDTLAHNAAVQHGGRTMAVLGSGLDRIYPGVNKALAEWIAKQGALVSEFPLGTKPDRNHFPRRNRIIGGLSLGTLVIEAGDRSGALITAAMALEQNREVFAVPGNIDSARSLGTNELIKQGAKLVTSVDDVLTEIAAHLQVLTGPVREATPAIPDNLTEEEKSLLEHITNEPSHIDKIALAAQKSPAEVLSVLLSLELKEVVKQLSGKLFVRLR